MKKFLLSITLLAQISFAQPALKIENDMLVPAKVNAAAANGTGAQGREGTFFREQVYHVPLKGEPGRRIATMLFRPNGNASAPLVIMTHGTEASMAKNRDWKVGIYPHAISWFAERGYAVAVVHRRGFGLTGGALSENFTCALPNHVVAGENAAQDITSVIDYMIRLPFIKDKGVFVLGQSTGGWSALATASTNHPAVKGVINFAGGRRGTSGKDGSTCALDELVRDASLLGMRAKIPSLWIYTQNDQTFDMNVVKRMYIAYSSGGAPTEFHMLEPFGRDGHSLFPSPRGLPMWGALVKRFIEK